MTNDDDDDDGGDNHHHDDSLYVPVACPEIAKQSHSDIELSTYDRTNGTTVLIGCKGFGRHISGPISVECLDTGAWSETPNLKCKVALDLKEKVIVGTAAVSAALVIIIIVCLCCISCCCRRRRRHYHHRYHGWRGSSDNWRDRWPGWTTGWFKGSGDAKDFKKSNHFHEYSSGPSKNFVNEFAYSRGDREKGSFSKKSGFFRSSRRFSDGDKHSIDREIFSKKYSGKMSDDDKHSVHRHDFLRKSNFLQDSGKYSDIDKHSIHKKTNFLKQSGKYSDADKLSVHRQDVSKRSNFVRQSGWHSDRNMYSDRNKYSGRNMFSGMYSGDKLEGRRKGWRGWTDSLRENWIDWRSRTFGDSPADGSVRRHDRAYDNSYPGRGFNKEEYERYSNGNKQEIMRSRRLSNDDLQPPDDLRRGRRYSDSSLVAQRQRFTRREASYDSRPDDVHYSRARRYSDPMMYRSEYGRYGHEASRDSYKPSFNIIRYDDSRHHMIKGEPTSFEYSSSSNKPTVHYSGAETQRYVGPAQILDPVYYSDPQHYHVGLSNNAVLDGQAQYSGGAILGGQTQYSSGAILGGQSRYSSGAILGGQTRYSGGAILDGQTRYSGGAILGGRTQYSGGAILDGKKLNYTSGHVNTDGLLRLPPISLDQLSKVVNVDLNGLQRSYSNRVVSSPRITELDGNRHVTSRLVGNDLGRIDTGHFEVLKVNPSADSFIGGAQVVPAENSSRTDGHYTLYQGKGRTKQLHNL
ncbi:uncharacterized protein LOC132735616 [Ruditapes philippinarum]|uniref:uncharacterized protein LOC132735616 n=1 Tax=Ruditapes philippinarum TaxID=129788 RepID=UPI00295BA3D8|nr:uncharacterized protein LOC132735616 [Ruditapes philippinarum]